MKLKLTEDGKAAAILDGRPIYIRDDGTEVPFDAPATVATITRLNGEAKAHREGKEAAETKLKLFEGIDDPEVARKAIELTKNIDDGKLLSAGKVEEIKVAARKAAEEQVAAANKAGAEALKATEADRDKLRNELYSEKIGGSFNRSKLIQDKFAIPADMVQARFGQNFKVEDGKIVAYDAAGNKVFSPSKPGELADFDEALDVLVAAYPYKDQILKGTGARGDGARTPNGGHGAGKTMTKAAFDALTPAQQAATMTGKDIPTLVD
jgi:hypothetical protein